MECDGEYLKPCSYCRFKARVAEAPKKKQKN
jgi:hypothetical protein